VGKPGTGWPHVLAGGHWHTDLSHASAIGQANLARCAGIVVRDRTGTDELGGVGGSALC
jgi:hypothetical protein